MTLREKQSRFAMLLPLLVQYAYMKGYELTLGDAWAHDGHIDDSFHYKRLAQDFNLFYDGIYLTDTEDYRFLGEYWESLDMECSWGGRWNDGCHFSYGEKGRK